MHKTTLYLPDDLRRELDATARRTGRTQADLIRQALSTFLEGLATPAPRSLGAGEDVEVSGRDSEDWLRARWRPR